METDHVVANRRPVVSPSIRLFACAAVGAAMGAGVAVVASWQLAILGGWNSALAVFLVWVWFGVGRLDADATRALAVTEDLSHVAAEVLIIVASVVNLSVIGAALVEAAARPSMLEASLINGACVLAVVLSWAVLHTGYSFRYARIFYERDGGIDIAGGSPDYRDFAYVAFTIGMTYQVSDTPLTSKIMRRSALTHMLLSYLFGAVILASVINVVAGLFRG